MRKRKRKKRGKDDGKREEIKEYLAQILGDFSSKFELTSDMDGRSHVPICKKKDLDQAAERIFEKTAARAWNGLSDEDIAGVFREPSTTDIATSLARSVAC